MKKFAIILSGCGVFDGAEIHETTLTMLAVAKHGCSYDMYAPDIEQFHVINHLNGETMNEKRNVLIESARIARGDIKSLSELNVNNYDAVIFPGGYGAAKNLCSFAIDRVDFKVNSEVERVIIDAHKAGKPIGALCIAPVLIAKVIKNAEVTIGKDQGTADVINSLGGKHVETDTTDVAVDSKNKIVTTPCYMLANNIYEIAQGAENLVKEIINLT